MSENFKVNSKTSTLEFKRKHNDLVDGIVDIVNDAIEEGEINAGGYFAHHIGLSLGVYGACSLTIYNNSETPFTAVTLRSALYRNGYTQADKSIEAASAYLSINNRYIIRVLLFANNANVMQARIYFFNSSDMTPGEYGFVIENLSYDEVKIIK